MGKYDSPSISHPSNTGLRFKNNNFNEEPIAGSLKLLRSDIEKFQYLYKVHSGLSLSPEEAHRELAMLVRQVEIAYTPVSITQLERLCSKYAGGRS